ncbi:hypothetical protein F7P69_20715 [Cellulosimicrobium funkei]|nr:hypothetical protein [Cellulosimicrobium funkei]
MAIEGWTVDAAGTRGVITKTLVPIDDLPGCADDMVTAFSDAATACDHVAIGSMLDTVLQTFVSPLYDASYNAGNYVLVQLEEAVRAYVDSDAQMGEDALASMDDIPRGED